MLASNLGLGALVLAEQLVTSLSFSGIERHVLRSSVALEELGCRSVIAAPEGAERLRAEAKRMGLTTRPLLDTRLRPDVLHVHDGRGAVLAAALRHRPATRLVRTQHFLRPASVDRDGWRRRGSLELHRRLNRGCDGYVAISQVVADAAVARREAAAPDVTVIPPAVELPEALRAQRALATRAAAAAPVVAFAGRLVAERRLDVLLRAVPVVLRAMPGCRFLIAGEGEDSGSLRRLAAELGVAQSVEWAGWVGDPYTVFERAHVYVNPWPEEGFGMAMAEAMAIGLPVVAPRRGASVEMIEHGATGWLVEPGSPAALADAVVRAVLDRSLAARLGAAARIHATGTFGAAVTGELTLQLYDAVLGR